MRNRTAAFYRILEIYPLADILAMETGVFDDARDGDKAVYDWLVAVTDDEKLIRKHYDTLDTATIDKLLIIYRRVNKIDDKENLLKNLLPTGKEG